MDDGVPWGAAIAGAVGAALFMAFVFGLMALATTPAQGAELVCRTPQWTLTVRELLPEQDRVAFREGDELYSRVAMQTGQPRGYEIRRVMANAAQDYMLGCIDVDCSSAALFGPSTTFTVVLEDSTEVRSLRILFFDGPLARNTRVWDTSRGQLVNPCNRDLGLARDVKSGCVGCAIAFPYRSIGSLRRVARLRHDG